jgi:acetamidase/formamidase
MKDVLFVLLLLVRQVVAAQADTTAATGRFISFTPTKFYREYYAGTTPVLTIQPGDIISTESIDAGGFDKNGERRSERGNPLTGPFYIQGALAGDAIAVTLTRIKLNRTYATTLEALVPKSLPGNATKKMWRSAKLVRWHVDTLKNTASPANKHEHLKNFEVPLHPFLGCVGVAPANAKKIPSGASGIYGGNLDFKMVTGSSTLYLPVFNDGALLSLGDGHALQGDGELNGDALETSMSFDFTVRVIKNGAADLKYPRMEDEKYRVAFGIEKNLTEALKAANQNMLDWLQKDYGLSYLEATQVIGTSMEYRIPKIAASLAEVAAMIPKSVLQTLRKSND